MTYSFRYDSGSALYLRLCEELLENGEHVKPRGLPTRELRSIQIEITDPAEVHILSTARKPDMKRAATEAMQLIGGISSLEQLNLASNGWHSQYSNDGRLRGAYGPRAYLQLINAERLLRQDHDTRQAGITLWNGNETAVQSRDIPCTTQLQFYRRHDKLELDVTMRSNDLLAGFPTDIMVFSCLQRAMAASLGIEPGPYRHSAGSLHVREDDLDRLRFVVKTGIIPESGMTQIPLPVPYFTLEDRHFNRGFSMMAVSARQICLRANDDGFQDREWLIQRIPSLGPGWDSCPSCRYVVKIEDGCPECSHPKVHDDAQRLQVPVEELRKYTSRYVAVRDGRVISSAADITGVIHDLRLRGLIAQAVFRVPAG